MELLGTSTSSATIRSARLPANCPVIPTLFTEGECEACAGPTSNATLDCLCPSRDLRC